MSTDIRRYTYVEYVHFVHNMDASVRFRVRDRYHQRQELPLALGIERLPPTVQLLQCQFNGKNVSFLARFGLIGVARGVKAILSNDSIIKAEIPKFSKARYQNVNLGYEGCI